MEKVIVIPQCRKSVEAQTLREKDCVLRALHYAMDGIKRVKTAKEKMGHRRTRRRFHHPPGHPGRLGGSTRRGET